MRIKPEHYKYLKAKITKELIADTRAKLLRSSRQPLDFAKRLRWDCLYAGGLSQWICDNLYPYLNDEHLDTALRNIFKELGE